MRGEARAVKIHATQVDASPLARRYGPTQLRFVPVAHEDRMGTRDKRVDTYIARSADFAKPILTHLREVVHETCPDVEEAMKWSFPHFMYEGMLCSMASFKEHCAFGFWKGALVLDGNGAPAEEAMGSFGRIT